MKILMLMQMQTLFLITKEKLLKYNVQEKKNLFLAHSFQKCLKCLRESCLNIYKIQQLAIKEVI